ncbi:endonuclease [Pseudalkalibacillus caeni]|uniref:Endonuclease n=2 Tax=Exobacillus caeni TaxID=2574798 RepID=A0A5R9F3N3_9BACL|nr:endonuclease [Pseudalkalibacillus caeni]
MIRKYQEGESTTVISEQANVSPRYVRQVLTDNNVQIRPRGHWKRQYRLNEHYFKTWSNNMAYILGFFVADGVINKDMQSVGFAQKEKYLLEDIKRELNSNQPLYKNNSRDVYILMLHSKILKVDLMEIHGITPAKSNVVSFPNIPDEFMHHFVRGYFDGDGHVNYERYNVSFVGGSYHFMEQLKTVLENQKITSRIKVKGKHVRLFITGRRTISKFADWIYKDKDIYLKRKFQEFEKETLPLNLLKDRPLKNNKEAVAKRKTDFLTDYAKNGSIETACKKIGIKITTFELWLKKDSVFKTLFMALNNKNRL